MRKLLSRPQILVRMALFGALAFILGCYFEFPIPFLAPDFYKFDFAEVPALIGTFMMGPVVGALIEVLKILLLLAIKGTRTAFVGELANFVIALALIVPAGWYYRRKRTMKALVIGSILGIVSMTVIGALFNYFILIPVYATAFHIPLETIFEIGHQVNHFVVDLRSFVVAVVVPFNIVKGILVTFVAGFLYRRLEKRL